MKLQNLSRVDYVNYLILLYAFVLSFPVALKTPILILLILFWITDRKKYDLKFVDLRNISIAMGIFLFYIIISSFWSDASVKEIFTGIKKYWYFLPMFIIYKYIKKEYILYTISSFLLGMLLSEIISYGIIFSLWKVRLGSPENPSMFLHHIQYSVFLSLTAIILFFKALYEDDKKIKFLYFIFFTTVTVNLFFNVGRTGYITFLAGMFISLFSIYRLKLKVILSTVISSVAIVTLVYSVSPNFQKRVGNGIDDIQKLSQKGNFDTSIGARLALWIAAEDIFEKAPVLGVGISNHLHKKDEFATSAGHEKFNFLLKIEHFHNSFLEILTQFGLIGLSLFIYILYLIGKITIQNRDIKILKISLFAIFILGNFTDRLFYLNSTMSLFALMCGLIFAQYRFENSKR